MTSRVNSLTRDGVLISKTSCRSGRAAGEMSEGVTFGLGYTIIAGVGRGCFCFCCTGRSDLAPRSTNFLKPSLPHLYPCLALTPLWARSPLYALFSETLDGAVTIRAFGQQVT